MTFRKIAALIGLMIAIAATIPQAFAAATLLPNGRQQFFSGAGIPLAGGFVYFYVPTTSTLKNTWQDPGVTTLNTNPVVLDANGQATIYGIGQYRQVVQDSLGNLQWDQLTNEYAAALDVQSGTIVYGGTSTGIANTYAITLTPPVTTYIAGQHFQFIAHQTNSSAATLNVGGTGAKNIFKMGAAGPTALVSGDITIGNAVDVLYDGTRFQLLNPLIVVPPSPPSINPLSNASASAVKVTNDGSTPNTSIDITATSVGMVTTTGVTQYAASPSVVIDLTCGTLGSAANCMDGEARPTSGWVYLYLIGNGTTVAGLGTTIAPISGAPTMPTGYTYKYYAGSMRLDSFQNLMRTLQLNNVTQYTLRGGTNTVAFPTIASGIVGTFNTTTFTPVSQGVTSFVPATASKIKLQLNNQGSAGQLAVAPNVNFTGYQTANAPPFLINSSAQASIGPGDLLLETTTIQYAGNNASDIVVVLGWEDYAVND